jgi:hypothetical protein
MLSVSLTPIVAAPVETVSAPPAFRLTAVLAPPSVSVPALKVLAMVSPPPLKLALPAVTVPKDWWKVPPVTVSAWLTVSGPPASAKVPEETVSESVVIAARDGGYRADLITPPGKRSMTPAAFLRGRRSSSAAGSGWRRDRIIRRVRSSR